MTRGGQAEEQAAGPAQSDALRRWGSYHTSAADRARSTARASCRRAPILSYDRMSATKHARAVRSVSSSVVTASRRSPSVAPSAL